jgi:DNA-binding HxlR family transcriptional regulator
VEVVNDMTSIEGRGMSQAVRQIGDGWSLLIVWAALQGTTRFDCFQSRLGVARNILSNRLSKLVDEGVLVKRPVQVGGRRMEYRITRKGEALRPAIELIEGWGNAALANPPQHRHSRPGATPSIYR